MTTAYGCRYIQHGVCRKDWDPDIYDQVDICDLRLQCDEKTTTIDIAVRNCGDFYVYKSRQLPTVEGRDKVGIYCGTSQNISKGSINLLFTIVYTSLYSTLFPRPLKFSNFQF